MGHTSVKLSNLRKKLRTMRAQFEAEQERASKYQQVISRYQQKVMHIYTMAYFRDDEGWSDEETINEIIKFIELNDDGEAKAAKEIVERAKAEEAESDGDTTNTDVVNPGPKELLTTPFRVGKGSNDADEDSVQDGGDGVQDQEIGSDSDLPDGIGPESEEIPDRD